MEFDGKGEKQKSRKVGLTLLAGMSMRFFVFLKIYMGGQGRIQLAIGNDFLYGKSQFSDSDQHWDCDMVITWADANNSKSYRFHQLPVSTTLSHPTREYQNKIP
jgi:hypothetical protein